MHMPTTLLEALLSVNSPDVSVSLWLLVQGNGSVSWGVELEAMLLNRNSTVSKRLLENDL